jgi:hypothetical protein
VVIAAGGLGCILPQTPSRGARDERGSSLRTQKRNISQQQHSKTSLYMPNGMQHYRRCNYDAIVSCCIVNCVVTEYIVVFAALRFGAPTMYNKVVIIWGNVR